MPSSKLSLIIFITIAPFLLFSQNEITINVYSYTNDYIAQKYTYENAIAEIKESDRSSITVFKIKDAENNKEIKHGEHSWAIEYNNEIYVNFESFLDKSQKSNKFLKMNAENENYLAYFPDQHSRYFRNELMPTPNSYGTLGLAGALLTNSGKKNTGYYWEGEDGGAYAVFVLNKKKIRKKGIKKRSKLNLNPFTKKNFNQIMKLTDGEEKSKSELREFMYEDLRDILYKYFGFTND